MQNPSPFPLASKPPSPGITLPSRQIQPETQRVPGFLLPPHPSNPILINPILYPKYMSSASASCHVSWQHPSPCSNPLYLDHCISLGTGIPTSFHPHIPLLHRAAKELSRNANLIFYRTLRTPPQPNEQNGAPPKFFELSTALLQPVLDSSLCLS